MRKGQITPENAIYWLLAFAVLLFLILMFKGAHEVPYEERTDYVLDTYVTVKVYDRNLRSKKDLQELFDRLRSYEKIFNFYDPESELSVLNHELERKKSASIGSKDLKNVLDLSLKIADLTEGAFDPSLGNLMLIWSFDKGGKLPSQGELSLALKSSGYRKLKMKEDRLECMEPVKLDLGGIAKGYCVDRAADLLKGRGYRKFLINSVSSTYVYNTLDDEVFKIGIEHPRREGLLGIVYVRGSAAISTSADNQKYFMVGGKRYHHLIDPKTGYPARGFISVTVIVEGDAAYADALSTALFVMGPDKALNFARENDLKIVGLTDKNRLIIYPQGDWFESERN